MCTLLKSQDVNILGAKYSHSITHASPFWKVLKDIDLINLGFNKKLGSGHTVLFWIDRWHNGCALYCVYLLLFSIVSDVNITVANVFSNGSLHIEFRIQLVGAF
jgi:hypothetical protein